MSCILFISNKCSHCIELLKMMNNMENMEKLENTSREYKKYECKIPDFIDRVPLLLIQNERKIIHDENYSTLLNQMKKR